MFDPAIENATWETTPEFIPPITGGKVIKVYDGDTITIASRLPYQESPVYRFTVRINGIDTPEIKGKTATEKALAIQARNALALLILGKTVKLENVKLEKYGRLLADVWLDETNLGKHLIESNYAVPYSGGTKIRPAEWDA